LEKYSNIKFHENPPDASRVVPYVHAYIHTDRQTDRLEEDNRRFLKFCEKRLKITQNLTLYAFIFKILYFLQDL